jgi:hypothetical protein
MWPCTYTLSTYVKSLEPSQQSVSSSDESQKSVSSSDESQESIGSSPNSHNASMSQGSLLPMHQAKGKWPGVAANTNFHQYDDEIKNGEYADPNRKCNSNARVCQRLQVTTMVINEMVAAGYITGLVIGPIDDLNCGYGGIKSMRVNPYHAKTVWSRLVSLFNYKFSEYTYSTVGMCMGLKDTETQAAPESWCVFYHVF